MRPEITSIPEMLIKHYGNMTALASELGVNRHTVRKFHRDTRCEMHVIYNGVLMTKSKMKGRQGRNMAKKNWINTTALAKDTGSAIPVSSETIKPHYLCKSPQNSEVPHA